MPKNLPDHWYILFLCRPDEGTMTCHVIIKKSVIVAIISCHFQDCGPVTKLHFKHSRWWRRGSRWSKFKLHTTLEGPMEGVCECKVDVKSMWIPTWHRMDYVSWSLELISTTMFWKQARHKTIGRP